MSQTVFIIGGPTASGKSALAMLLAEKIPAVIINADSMQVYRELPIITAQPTLGEQQAVPHRLYSILDASERGSVSRWCRMAKETIEQAFEEKKVPVLVGGTGMYILSLMEGISEIPPVDDEIRDRAQEELEKLGHEAFHARLTEKDPETGARLKVGDTQRILRAWEVYLQTGVPLSTWHQNKPKPYLPKVKYKGIFLNPPREVLYERANERFLNMFENGALEEVERLRAFRLDPSLPAMRAHGVPELISYLEGTMKKEDAITKAQTHTRNYIKRQLTWHRNQMQMLPECETPEAALAELIKKR